MTKKGEKEGLATKEEIKILWGVVSGEIKVPVLLKPLVNIVIPNMLDSLDNKWGDRLPEPWQTHCEKLVTMVVTALEDKVIEEHEVTGIMEYAAVVVNEKIDLPLLSKDVQAMLFIETFKMAGVLLYGAFAKKQAA
jgi:hypothetical protein